MKGAPAAFNSFDCFDTLLATDLRGHQTWSSYVEQRLPEVLGCDPGVIQRGSRALAEAVAYRKHGAHTTLLHIADAWASVLHTDAPSARELQRAELDLVRESSYGVVSNVRLFNDAQDTIVVSDTWHSSAFLAELLRANGVKVADDSVFCSNECGATKASGRLFSRLPVSRGWRHYGNDRVGDVTMARRAGATAVFLGGGNEHPVESYLRAQGGLAAELGAAARRARLSLAMPYEIAPVTSLVNSLLILHTIKVLRDADARGTSTLVFLGRDGHGLWRAWEGMRDALGGSEPPSAVWLRAGRTAVRTALSDPDELEAARVRMGDIPRSRPYSFVDVGWQGRAAAELMLLLDRLDWPPPERFYTVGRFAPFPSGMATIFSADEDRGISLESSAVLLIELLLGLLEGPHTSFGAAPQDRSEPAASLDHHRELQRLALAALERQWEILGPWVTGRDHEVDFAASLICSRLNEWQQHPSRGEARLLGALVADTASGDAPFVMPYRLRDVLPRLTGGEGRVRRGWPAASWALANPLLRMARTLPRVARRRLVAVARGRRVPGTVGPPLSRNKGLPQG